jgi:hypothetical protein
MEGDVCVRDRIPGLLNGYKKQENLFVDHMDSGRDSDSGIGGICD